MEGGDRHAQPLSHCGAENVTSSADACRAGLRRGSGALRKAVLEA